MTPVEQTKRLMDWYNGDLPDSELTDADLQELQERIFAVIQEKLLAKEELIVFQQHRTLQ